MNIGHPKFLSISLVKCCKFLVSFHNNFYTPNPYRLFTTVTAFQSLLYPLVLPWNTTSPFPPTLINVDIPGSFYRMHRVCHSKQNQNYNSSYRYSNFF
jgi:hypothetical protein